MSQSHMVEAATDAARPKEAAPAGAAPKRRCWLPAARTRRVVLILAWIWVLNLFDLSYTLLSQKTGDFEELNPVARLYTHSPAMLAFFKVGMVATGSIVLVAFRRRRFTEAACWGLGIVYTLLALFWFFYLHRSPEGV